MSMPCTAKQAISAQIFWRHEGVLGWQLQMHKCTDRHPLADRQHCGDLRVSWCFKSQLCKWPHSGAMGLLVVSTPLA